MVLLDCGLNTLLGGNPRETVSARSARARATGNVLTYYFCQLLSWSANTVSFGVFKGDHCSQAIDDKVLPVGKEIWNWNRKSQE
jgi:hypothetical protein